MRNWSYILEKDPPSFLVSGEFFTQKPPKLVQQKAGKVLIFH